VDVHIGEISAHIDVSGDSGELDKAVLERIVRQVIQLIERRRQAEERARRDRAIESTDRGDLERYG
jgi:hypothetical protein